MVDTNGENLIMCAKNGLLWKLVNYVMCNRVLSTTLQKALHEAVQNERIAVVEFLLTKNLDLEKGNLLLTACHSGNEYITELLLRNGAQCTCSAFLEAVYSCHTDCVITLITHGADIHVNDSEALIHSCENNMLNIVKVLLLNGADVNVRNGKVLVDACIKSNEKLVELLLKFDADPEICEYGPLRASAQNGNLNILKLLLDSGAEAHIIEKSDCDEFTFDYLQNYRKEHLFQKLKNSVKSSLSKKDFKWQELCSLCPKSTFDKQVVLGEIKRQALFWNVENISSSKRSICAEISHKLQTFGGFQFSDELTDFSGTPLKDLPAWNIIYIDGNYFNCFDLFSMLNRGMTRNPYTNLPLPVEKIIAYKDWLRKVLTRTKFKYPDIIDLVKNTPVLNQYQILRERLLREIWEKLTYPPDPDVFLNGSDANIDTIVSKLYGFTDYDWVYDQESQDIYPMLTISVLFNIRLKTGYAKKLAVLNLMSQILSVDDEFSTTRALCLSMLFQRIEVGDFSEDSDNEFNWTLNDYDADDDF